MKKSNFKSSVREPGNFFTVAKHCIYIPSAFMIQSSIKYF